MAGDYEGLRINDTNKDASYYTINEPLGPNPISDKKLADAQSIYPDNNPTYPDKQIDDSKHTSPNDDGKDYVALYASRKKHSLTSPQDAYQDEGWADYR